MGYNSYVRDIDRRKEIGKNKGKTTKRIYMESANGKKKK